MDYSHDIESARKAMEARYKDIVAKRVTTSSSGVISSMLSTVITTSRELSVIGSLSSRGAVW